MNGNRNKTFIPRVKQYEFRWYKAGEQNPKNSGFYSVIDDTQKKHGVLFYNATEGVWNTWKWGEPSWWHFLPPTPSRIAELRSLNRGKKKYGTDKSRV